MAFLDVENRAGKEIVPGIQVKTFWEEQSTAMIADVAPGAIVPLHAHPHEQSGVVLFGSITFTVNGETRTLGAGDCYIIPGGVEHSAVGGNKPSRLFEVFSPLREEYKFD